MSWSDLPCLIQYVMAWTEWHSGLAGWVAAIGSVLAIAAAWFLAHLEYKRDQRNNAARKRREIDLITRILSDFESQIMHPCTQSVRNGRLIQLAGFYNLHLNDPELHSMRDLAHIPVMQWPSLEAFMRFKQYWFISVKILEAANNVNIGNPIDLDKEIREHDTRLEQLKVELEAVRVSS